MHVRRGKESGWNAWSWVILWSNLSKVYSASWKRLHCCESTDKRVGRQCSSDSNAWNRTDIRVSWRGTRHFRCTVTVSQHDMFQNTHKAQNTKCEKYVWFCSCVNPHTATRRDLRGVVSTHHLTSLQLTDILKRLVILQSSQLIFLTAQKFSKNGRCSCQGAGHYNGRHLLSLILPKSTMISFTFSTVCSAWCSKVFKERPMAIKISESGN